MKTFDVQSIGIDRPAQEVFEYVANPANLPNWTNAFKSATILLSHATKSLDSLGNMAGASWGAHARAHARANARACARN